MKIIIITLAWVFISSTILFANGMNKNMPVNGIGISCEFDIDKNANAAAFDLSYKYGFFQVISGFLSADMGYKTPEKAAHARIGVEGLLVFVGLETGFTMLYTTADTSQHSKGDSSPGMYIGLAGGLPDTQIPSFLSFGGNFYFHKHSPEFYAKLTILLNFVN